MVSISKNIVFVRQWWLVFRENLLRLLKHSLLESKYCLFTIFLHNTMVPRAFLTNLLILGSTQMQSTVIFFHFEFSTISNSRLVFYIISGNHP